MSARRCRCAPCSRRRESSRRTRSPGSSCDRRRVAIIAAVVVALSPFTWIQSGDAPRIPVVVRARSRRRGRDRARRARPNGRGRGRSRAAPRLRRRSIGRSTRCSRRCRCSRTPRSNCAAAVGLAAKTAPGPSPARCRPRCCSRRFNTLVMGAPWNLPFGVSGPIDRFGFGWRTSFVVPGSGRDGQVHYTVGRALGARCGTPSSAFPRFVVATPVLLLLAVFVVVRQRRDPRVWLLVGMIATFVVGLPLVVGCRQRGRVRPDAFASGPSTTTSRSARSRCSPRGGSSMCGGPTARRRSRRTRDRVDGARDLRSCCTTRAMPATRRAAEAALTDAPGPRLVLEDPLFPGDPYVRVANDAALEGRRVVGIDIPGHRLDAVERFPDRGRVSRARLPSPPATSVGPIRREQVPLEIVEGDRVQLTADWRRPAGPPATAYLRIGQTTASGADLRRDLGDDCRPTSRRRHRGRGRLPDVAADEFVECRSEARRTSGDGPCACSHRATAMSATRSPMAGRPSRTEDVSGRRRRLAPAAMNEPSARPPRRR